MTDQTDINDFLKKCRIGILALINEEKPYAVPLNYIYFQKSIYFHSSLEGKKMDIIRTEPSVQFTVIKEYSYIPSYFLDADMACSASQLYKSVMINGRAEIVEAMEEKINVLNEMMRVFQPEGHYEKIEEDKHDYKNMLARTAVIKIEITDMTAKFKFGQQLSEGKLRLIINNLKKSGNPLDQETVVLMEKYWKMYWKKDK